MITQTKVILLSQAIVLVEKAVDVQLPGPNDVITNVMHSQTYKRHEPRSLDRHPSTVKMDLEAIPNELDWGAAGLNQMLAMTSPDGQVMLAYGWVTPAVDGVV